MPPLPTPRVLNAVDQASKSGAPQNIEALHTQPASVNVAGTEQPSYGTADHATVPAYTDLFNIHTVSDVDDAHSLVSAHAYLVDLLQFIEHTIGKDAVDDIINYRRPD